ncbi:G-D-S-L family lipolytic protein [Lentiprolixibacter aurantiacus]|uniref:G-D-S-L family lipolytic protein n=1 Tax=Lentiprolixibacter aurantiacus TaxID=2993939 RepID=A0AAE3MLH8_9FLAO|nr:G-D-S-L family lipolytic protein [Lentiprolixibacter aurantiacus]MCX2719094.1 G-D-S-L family lipolytic protein [Lentiprolixibacter aurantiacus]
MKKIWMLFAIGGLFLISCSDDDVSVDQTPDPDPIVYTSGTADFSNFVALGNSLTAGFSDAALFIDGQNASVPSIMAGNFALAGGGDFTIPYMADNLGGLTLGGVPIPQFGNRLILDFSTGDPIPVPVSGTGTTEVSNVLTGPFNNLGVPGAKSFHLLAPGYGNVAGVALGQANPYYARFASSPNARIIEDAAVQNPSFFALWIGNGDVLGYAIEGGDGENQAGNTDPSTYESSDITDPTVFAGSVDLLLQTLTANGAGGVIGNVFDVTTIPYFTTVPYNPLDPTNPDFGPQIPLLNSIFGALNQIYSAIGATDRIIVFSETEASPVVIFDENLADLSATITGGLLSNLPAFEAFIAQFGLPPQAAPLVANLLGSTYGQTRQATAEDLVVLTSARVIGTVNTDTLGDLVALGLPEALAGQFSVEGISLPLADKWVLTPEEQMLIKDAQEVFNQTIAALAQQYDIALADVNALLAEVDANGLTLSDGRDVTTAFATGGAFSLDGIHPSPRGNALLANVFIEAINAKYGSNLPNVDPLDYIGLYLK